MPPLAPRTPGRLIRAAVLLALLAGCVGAAPRAARAQAGAPPGRSDLPSRSATPPYFLVDTTMLLSHRGRPGVRITVSIPYHQLHFVRTGDGYEAVFDISEIFYDRKKRQVTGDVWRHRVGVRRYRETRAAEQRYSNSEEFELEPGRYTLVVRVQSYDTLSGSEATRVVEVQAVEAESFAVAGLEIGTCRDSLGGAVDDEASGFELSWTRRFGDPLPHACVRAELFEPGAAAAARTVGLTVEVLAGDRSVVAVEQALQARGPRSVFVVGMPIGILAPGSYTLRLTARHAGREASAGRDFEIDASRIDLSRNYDDLLRLAGLFLDEDVEAELGGVPEAERRERWQAYWRRRDPDPETEKNELLEEFFRRVRASATRFGHRGASGWATDRGKVYVRYGEPEDIENVPRGFNTPAYEIWRYVDLNLTFVFADTSGFGDFILVQPSPPPF